MKKWNHLPPGVRTFAATQGMGGSDKWLSERRSRRMLKEGAHIPRCLASGDTQASCGTTEPLSDGS
jgi:hypothetical protein